MGGPPKVCCGVLMRCWGLAGSTSFCLAWGLVLKCEAGGVCQRRRVPCNAPSNASHMGVSHNKGTPIWTPKYDNPYYWDPPKRIRLILGNYHIFQPLVLQGKVCLITAWIGSEQGLQQRVQAKCKILSYVW